MSRQFLGQSDNIRGEIFIIPPQGEAQELLSVGIGAGQVSKIKRRKVELR